MTTDRDHNEQPILLDRGNLLRLADALSQPVDGEPQLPPLAQAGWNAAMVALRGVADEMPDLPSERLADAGMTQSAPERSHAATEAHSDDETAELRAEVEWLRVMRLPITDLVQELNLARQNHRAELDRANRLERMTFTMVGKAVDLEDRARAAEDKVERIEAVADLIARHVERESDPCEFRHPDTGAWHDVADEIRAALEGDQ